MNRATARLINAVGYRMKLARDLPQLEAKLLALLLDGKELRTRRWVVRREASVLVLAPNDSPSSFRQIPLEMSSALRK